MRGRELITLFGRVAAVWPVKARAQQPERMRCIGVIVPFTVDDSEVQGRVGAFLQELQHLGWAIGLILVALTVWPSRSTPALAVEPQIITPDTTLFKFSSETKGSKKFCSLLLAAVKLPSGITFNALANRFGSDIQNIIFGYEIEAFESKFRQGRQSDTKLKIKEASISSDIFSSKGSVERAPDNDLVVYVINDTATAVSNFIATVTKGSYTINVELSDGRSLTYVIKGDASLSDAADKWTKCTIQIAK